MTGAAGPASLARWTAMWRALGGSGDPEPAYRDLIAAYADPARRYHSLEHLANCLAEFDRSARLARHPAEVEAALWFHDAVYQPQSGDNEERSAQWAERVLSDPGVPAERVARIRQLILATRHVEPPADPDAELVTDIDLAILGASAEEYRRYAERIRQEYAWVPEPEFRRRRAAVLERLLRRRPLYRTEPFRTALEARARENLQNELDGLR